MKCPACGHEWRLERPGLTPKQAAILQWMRANPPADDIGYSMREIAAGVGRHLSPVQASIASLARMGYVTHEKHHARSVRLIEA